MIYIKQLAVTIQELVIMKFVKLLNAKNKIKVINIDDQLCNESRSKTKHGGSLPNTIRGIIVGPSNVGKTNVLISLIISPNGLVFKNLYVYSKSLNQPKYQYLEKIMNNLKKDNINHFTISNNTEIHPLGEVLENSIFIFDDIICFKQNIIKEYFSMGRH